jgi:hypothetical protein
MLRAEDQKRKWDVASMSSSATFDDWIRGVDLVNRFRFRAEGPRLPMTSESPILEALLHPRAELMTFDFRAKFGVDLHDRVVRECVRMAGGGLGEVLAVGRKNGDGLAGKQKAWVSANSVERVTQEVPLDSNTGEVADSELLDVLAALPTDNPW